MNFKEFGKIKWKRVWARRILLFLGSGFQKVFLRHKPYTLARHKMYVPEGNLFAFCIAQKEFEGLVKIYTAKLMKTDLALYAKEYEREFAGYLDFAESFSKKSFKTMSDIGLSASMKELDERIVDFYEYQFYPFLVLEGLGGEVERRISILPNGPEILQSISEPYKLTVINQAHLELLKLAQSVKIDDSKIKDYASEYGWMSVYDYPDEPWTWQEVRKQIQEIKDPKKVLRESEINRKKHLAFYSRYIKEIKDPIWRKKVEVLHYFSYLKEMRDDYRRKAYALVRPVWDEVAHRLGSTVLDLNYLTGPELVAIIAGKRKLPVEEINRRKECSALASVEGRVEVFNGAKARKLASFVLDKWQKEIKGTIACKGKVTGKCKIIYHRGEFGKFKKGEILVTTMTHPEFLQIMKKAKAIVTDEGGMICHAAIVSRELKIPCIIGTKNATRVLKDGDLVEVDANKGIVRKI